MDLVMFSKMLKNVGNLSVGNAGDYIADLGFDGVDLTVRPEGHVLPEEAASLAARTNPIKGFEYNARQYLPFAYKAVQEKHQSLFQVKDGRVSTKSLQPVRSGFSTEGINF